MWGDYAGISRWTLKAITSLLITEWLRTMTQIHRDQPSRGHSHHEEQAKDGPLGPLVAAQP